MAYLSFPPSLLIFLSALLELDYELAGLAQLSRAAPNLVGV